MSSDDDGAVAEGDRAAVVGGDGGVAPAESGASASLLRALETLRGRLGGLRLPLELPGVAEDRAGAAAARGQLDDYLLPRLRSRAAPLLVVVGGSTGAGKSTLVNSLLGEQVSAGGVLRPTTRAPVLVHHPSDAVWFTGDRILPGLARRTDAVGAGGTSAPAGSAASSAGPGRELRLVASDALPAGLAVVDAPDVDSVETQNRELAAQLLAAADLWLFVTTAARYADAVAWDLLLQAAERHAQVALVVDRVDPGAEAVVADLRRMMETQGLEEAPLFVVPELPLAEGLLPADAVAPVSRWLSDLGSDAGERARIADATRDGVVDDLVRRSMRLAAAAEEQSLADARLREVVRLAYDDAAREVDSATSDGVLLRGEVLARWQDFVGTGEFFRGVERGVGRVRDAVVGFFSGRPTQAPQVESAIADGLEAVVLDACDGAAERTFATWRSDPAGAHLVDLELNRSSPAARAEVAEQIRAWQSDVLELVREQGAHKRGTARALSFGLNGLGVSLMVVVFASTGGLTGAELGIAGGTAVVAQKLLEAVFGDDAVRRLARQARERLGARVRRVCDAEAERYTRTLDAVGAERGADDAAALREAAHEVEVAARTERATRPAAAPRVAGATPGRHAARRLRGADAEPTAPPEPGPEPEGGFWRRLFRGRRAGA